MASQECDYFENVVLFWNFFLKTDNKILKETYLELFLFELYKNEENILLLDTNSILSTVPYHLSSYILEMIYSTTTATISSNNHENDAKENQNCGFSVDTNGFYDQNVDGGLKRNMLTQSIEQNHVQSLREILLSGTGGRILEVLQGIRVNNIPYNRELVNLLINLFPTVSWNDSNVPDDPKLHYKDAITLLELTEKLTIYDYSQTSNLNTRCKEFTRVPDDNAKYSRHVNEYDILNESDFYSSSNIDIKNYITDDFKVHIKRKIPSKQFSVILINLLLSITCEENLHTVTDKSSATLQSLNFCLKKLKLINKELSIFPKDSDRTVISSKLITLLILCLNNIFSSKKILINTSHQPFDIKYVLKQLVEILEYFLNDLHNIPENHNLFNIKSDIIFQIYYYYFIVINNLALLKVEWDQNAVISTIKKLELISFEIYNFFLRNERYKFFFGKISNIFIQIILNSKVMNNVCEIDYNHRHSKKQHATKDIFSTSKSLRHHYLSSNEIGLKCTVERLLLQIINYIPSEETKTVLIFLVKNNICCCNCNEQAFEIFFKLSGNNQKKLKIILNIIKHNLIKTLSNSYCEICQHIITLPNFQNELIHSYLQLIDKMEEFNIYIILDHISSTSHHLPDDLSEKIIFEIAAPVFKKYKQLLVSLKNCDEVNNELKLSKQIVSSCLTMFSNFLNNETLINKFFTLMFVNDLNDVMTFHEIIPNIFQVIEIGLSKISSNDDHVTIKQKLKLMPIDLTLKTTENLLHFFTKLNKSSNNKFNFKTVEVMEELNDNSTSILIELRLSVVYWNMILQLLQKNEEFKNEFYQKYINMNQDTLIVLVHNILSCLLNFNAVALNNYNYSNISSMVLADYCVIPEFDEITNETELKDFGFYNINEQIYDSNSYEDCDNNNDINVQVELHKYFRSINLNKFVPKGIFSGNIISSDVYKNENNSPTKLRYINVFEDYANILHIEELLSTLNTKLIFNINIPCQSKVKRLENNYFTTMDFVTTECSSFGAHNKIIFKNSSKGHITKSDSFLDNVLYRSVESVIKINKFLHSFFNFTEENDTSTDDDYQLMKDIKLLTSPDCRKTLFQLFEIVLSVVLLDLQEHVFELKMSPALEEIKLMLLTQSNEYWDNLENGTAIMNVLQSLLKISKCKNMNENFSATIHREDSHTECHVNEIEFKRRFSFITTDDVSTDIELSDDNNEDYVTADEGYEADAENCNKSDDSENICGNKSHIAQSTNIQTCLIHNGICKIIIEVLFEFSERCVTQPLFWPGILNQIITRLSVIKKSLGEPALLIKGFRSILSKNDEKFQDLQRSILELITDLNDPESLSEYLKLFASQNPPTDLLLARLRYFVNSSPKIEPSVQIQFPCILSDVLENTSEIECIMKIKALYNNHRNCNLDTAVTQSALIVPINYVDFNPWLNSGFTTSFWCKSVDTNSTINSYKNASNDDLHNLHLISIGNKKLVFSIYIDSRNGNSLYLHLTKPNCEGNITKVGNMKSNSSYTNLNQNNVRKDVKRVKSLIDNSKEGLNLLLENNIESAIELEKSSNLANNNKKDEQINTKRQGSNILHTYNNAIKSTRSMIKTRLSSFTKFSLSKSIKANYISMDEIQPLEIPNLKLNTSKWTHLSFSVESYQNGIMVFITMDGTEKEVINIHCSADVFRNMKKSTNSFVCIGSKQSNNNGKNKIFYNMSNLMIFKQCIRDFSVLAMLVTLGPEMINFNCPILNNTVPNMSFLNNCKYVNDFDLNAIESIKILKCLLIGVYSAHNPKVFLGYNSDKTDRGSEAEVFSFVGRIASENIPSIQIASILCGGLSPLIFLFARVVELTSVPFLQASSLSIVLQIVYSNSELYSEFIKSDGMGMIGSVIRTKKCIKSLDLLKSVVDIACEGHLLTRKSQFDKFQVITNTAACVVHPDLLISIIIHYWDWYDPNLTHSDTLDVLFASLLALVREKHPHHSINVYRLTKSGIISALLNFCKIYLVGASRSVYISTFAASNLVNLVRVFAGAPPLPSLLDEIIKLLILLHRPSDSFVTHDRSKFYFLLTTLSANKQKRISLPTNLLKSGLSGLHARVRKSPILNNDRINESFRFERSLSASTDYAYQDVRNWGEILNTSNNMQSPSGTSFSEENNFDNSFKSNSSFEVNNDITTELYQMNSKNVIKVIEMLSPSKANQIIKLRKKKSHKSIKRKKYKSDIKQHMKKDITFGEYKKLSKPLPIVTVSNTKGNAQNCQITNDMFKAYKTPGFIKVQEDFFILLRDFILILPDNSIYEVLNHYITIEILMVLSNHHDIKVRTAIINLLSIICERLPQSLTSTNTSKQYHWYHLANQVSLDTVDEVFLNTCVRFITGVGMKIEESIEHEEIEVTQKYGLNILIAILPQTIHDPDLTIKAFQWTGHLYNKVPAASQYMIDNGLIFSIIKTITKIFVNDQVNEFLVETIIKLLTTICFKSFTSTGTINILWDVLNCLSFIEHPNGKHLQYGSRNAQAKILTYIIDECTNSNQHETSLLNFKIKNYKIVIPGCSLTSTELKTRFDMILDRTVQFLINNEIAYQPNDAEIKLIEMVVDLTINGQAKASNILIWTLCPYRQFSLKFFTLKSISNVKNLNKINCNTKTIKMFAQNLLLTNHEFIDDNEFEILNDFCDSLDGPEYNSETLSEILHQMRISLEIHLSEFNSLTERTIFKMESIAQNCIDSAMKITRNFVELQNMERRSLMNHMRIDDDKDTFLKWNMIIQNMTHEGAPWFSSEIYPLAWELDHTEGPSRTLQRFKRCYRNVEAKFLLNKESKIQVMNDSKCELLHYLMMSISQQCNFCSSDQVLYNFNVIHLLIDSEVEGELIVTETQIIFMPNININEPILCDITSIAEMWLRRFQHQDIALEFFLETGNTLFIILSSPQDRELLQKHFADKVVQCPDSQKLNHIVQQWREDQLTNWEYLMLLNQFSGRTYHDLMQYPIFPWVLSDYESEVLDLNTENSFRKFEKPIAIQHKENEAHYINNYEYLSQSLSGGSHLDPYHYGSHYSNSGTVLHFLVRLLPFTKLFLQYQDNNFDIPDRTFHALRTTWRLASKDSPTDVKELIPEFFSLPEMFENNEGFDFGTRQSGEIVSDVILPTWTNNSSRLFVLIHRQALESDFVRKQINLWIDLIFGYKQSGQAAIDAINVFHPATYYGFSCQNMSDPVEKTACETMVKTYGQMPRQLFKSIHPSANNQPTPYIRKVEVVPNVKGLKWGIYAGSPGLPEQRLCNIYQQFEKCSNILSLENTNVIYGIPDKCNIMQGVEQDTMNLISWNEADNVVRMKVICDDVVEVQTLIHKTRIDPITACGTNINSNQLWFGHKSGRIAVYYCTAIPSLNKYNKTFQQTSFSKQTYNSAFRKVSGKLISRPLELDLLSNTNSNNRNKLWRGPFNLIRHNNEIKVIKISVEFKIAISGGSDGVAVIWDINKLQYLRTISAPSSLVVPEIYLCDISSTLGDIITVHDTSKKSHDSDIEDESFEVTESNIDDFVKISMNLQGNSVMRLHTVNGKYINHVLLQEEILSICYSFIKEGTGINVILTGMTDGNIKVWSSWDLSFIKEINTGYSDVIGLTFSTYQHLIVLTKDDIIQVWESPGLNGAPPKIYFLKELFSIKN